MDVRYAHERIDGLERVMSEHLKEHSKLANAILENTQMTREISTNTAELVALVKGIKGFRSLVLWAAPFIAAMLATWAWFRGQV